MIDAQGICKFYEGLAKLHAEKRREAEEQNAFLWARLINLIAMIGSAYSDGSNLKDITAEAEATAKDLMGQLEQCN